jgi:hypothetical protein
VLDVADERLLRLALTAHGIVEVIGGSGEGVDFELVYIFLGKVGDQHVNYQRALDATLAMQNQHHFIILGVLQRPLDKHVTVSHILCVVEEVTFDEALYEIKEKSITVRLMSGWQFHNIGTRPTLGCGCRGPHVQRFWPEG